MSSRTGLWGEKCSEGTCTTCLRPRMVLKVSPHGNLAASAFVEMTWFFIFYFLKRGLNPIGGFGVVSSTGFSSGAGSDLGSSLGSAGLVTPALNLGVKPTLAGGGVEVAAGLSGSAGASSFGPAGFAVTPALKRGLKPTVGAGALSSKVSVMVCSAKGLAICTRSSFISGANLYCSLNLLNQYFLV